MKTIRLAILISALLSLIAGHALRTFFASPLADERLFLKELAPEARFLPKQGDPPVYLAENGAIAFNTHDLAPRIRGYAGPIQVLLVLDREARIKGIRILEHRETKNYVHYMETPAFLSQFIGKLASDPFEPDQDIDGITRATVSVKALASTVKESSRIVARNLLGMDIKSEINANSGDLAWLWYVMLFLFSMGGYIFTRNSKRIPWMRDASLIGGIVVIGFLLSAPFSILHVFNLVLGRPSSSLLWHLLVTTTLLSVALAGRFYCGWLCPFGALSEFLGRIPFRKWSVPARLDDAARKLKYLFLGLVTAIVLLSGRVDFGNYETYVTLFSFHGNAFTWSLVALSLVASLRIERFWCKYLCPVAAFTGLMSRKAQGYPSASTCPMSNKHRPLASECIRCNRCYTKPNAGEAQKPCMTS